MAGPLDPGVPTCPECGWPLPAERARCAGCNYPEPIPPELAGRMELGHDWPVIGCGGWLRGLKKIPPRLPCGVDDPQHYRNYHPEIAACHRAIHATWTRQVATPKRLWSVS
jgi:hypothetical protein